MTDPTIPAVQAMLLLAIVMLAGVIISGCAGPRYQPPGGGLSAVVAHTEAQRGKP